MVPRLSRVGSSLGSQTTQAQTVVAPFMKEISMLRALSRYRLQSLEVRGPNLVWRDAISGASDAVDALITVTRAPAWGFFSKAR